MNCDLLIIGAGPAGSAAAIQAASDGLEVILTEAVEFPRDRPGETLHPGIETLLDKLGINPLDFPRFEGSWVTWEGALRLQSFGSDPDGSWLGFHAWRADLDRLLLDRARSVGCMILQPVRAIKLLGHPGHVLTSHGVIRARCLVDASGRRNWFARHQQLSFHNASPTLLSTYSYAAGSAAGPDPLIEADSAGWTWTAQVRPNLTAWVRLNWTGRPSEERWRPERLRHLPDAGPVRRAETTWRRLDQPAGRGYFCVGDAASALDPCASQGVLKALMTGMMAGRFAARQFGNVTTTDIVQEYNQRLTDWFDTDVNRLRELYRRLPSPPPWV